MSTFRGALCCLDHDTDRAVPSTVYDIMNPTGTNYLAFMFWIGL